MTIFKFDSNTVYFSRVFKKIITNFEDQICLFFNLQSFNDRSSSWNALFAKK